MKYVFFILIYTRENTQEKVFHSTNAILNICAYFKYQIMLYIIHKLKGYLSLEKFVKT